MKKIFILFFIAFCGKLFSQNTTVYIPVVFHVLWNTSAQNIADAKILSQLQSLNDDYSDTSCTSIYSQDVNTNIQFCLATVDPNGNPTNGIIHKQTTTTSFSANTAVKYSSQGGEDAWDVNNYFNIWICNLGGGLLGYAQYPPLNNTYGAVVHYCTVGSASSPGACAPYQYGKILTFEIAECFTLPNIWASACTPDADGISDTPNQTSFTCTSTIDSCAGYPESYICMNFMSYADDAYKCIFTPGQKAKMWTAINADLTSLLSSNGCAAVGIENYFDENNISIFPNPFSGILNLKMSQFENLKIISATIYNVFGEKIYSSADFQINQSSNLQIDLSSQPSGIYSINILSDKFSITKQLAVAK